MQSSAEIRRARLQFKKGQITEAEYDKHVNEYMEYAIREQEAMDMDVLVHGEPERTDMYAYQVFMAPVALSHRLHARLYSQGASSARPI